MEKFFLIALFSLILVFYNNAENKVKVYVLPFIIELDNQYKNLSEKATNDFTEELEKIDFLQTIERSRYDSVLKKFNIYGMNKYNNETLIKIGQEVGKGVFLYGIVTKEKSNLKLAVKIYDPEKETITFDDGSSVNTTDKDIYACIKIQILEKIDIIKGYHKSILADNSDPKKNKYNLTKEEMLSLLKKCSYDGYTVLMEVERLDNKKENLMRFLTFNDSMSLELNTTVHEFCHRYNDLTGSFFISSKESIKLHSTETFPSIELVTVIPAELRTGRFKVYIDSDNSHQGTQIKGIYGLLDEFVAYYQGTKVSCDLVKYYKDVLSNDDAEIFIDALDPIYLDYFACYEFKFFIYTYLLYAKENHSSVYNNIINNQNFILTFNRIDELYSMLIKRIYSIEDDLDAFLTTKGWSFSKNKNFTFIKKIGSKEGESGVVGNFSDVIFRLSEELKKDKYKKLEKEVFKR